MTTLVDMPLNSVPATTSVVGAGGQAGCGARGRLHVDVGFWGGVVPGNDEQLEPLWDAGVLGFKCFLCPSGVDEFGHVAEADLRTAMPVLARLGAPLLAHAELPEPLARAALAVAELDPRSYAVYLASRPREAEQQAIELLIRLCRETGARIHVVHLADADALPLLRAARAEGLPITVETCPHYLHFAAEEIADGATDHKCAPPIREAENRERLWDALGAGDIDLIVTDHSPCPPAMKGLDTRRLPPCVGRHRVPPADAARRRGRARGSGDTRPCTWRSGCARRPRGWRGWTAARDASPPAATRTSWSGDPEAEFTVDPARLHHRHPRHAVRGCHPSGRGRRPRTFEAAGSSTAAGSAAEPTGRILSRHTR